MHRTNTTVLGIPVDLMTQELVIESIFTIIEEWRHTRVCQYVATLNVDFLNNTHNSWSVEPKNSKLLQALRSARIVTADGMPIVWYSKLLGQPIPERVTGADLIKPLAKACANRNKSIYLLGGKEHVANSAKKVLKQENPTLQIVGCTSPKIDGNSESITDNDQAVVNEINETKPDILLINLGNPKQELWFRRVQDILQVPVAIGIGGALSFIANVTPRAPKWMQKSGLEWLFRFVAEPKRLWKRYCFGSIKFLTMTAPAITRHFLSKMSAMINGGNTLSNSLLVYQHQNNENERAVLQLPHTINCKTCSTIKRDIDGALKNNDQLTLDFSDVTHIDLKGMTLLINTFGKENISALGISPSLFKLLGAHRSQDLISQKTFANQKRY